MVKYFDKSSWLVCFFKVCEEDIWGKEPELEAWRFFTSTQSEFMVVFVSVFKLYFVVCGGRKGPEDYFASEFWGVQREAVSGKTQQNWGHTAPPVQNGESYWIALLSCQLKILLYCNNIIYYTLSFLWNFGIYLLELNMCNMGRDQSSMLVVRMTLYEMVK